MMSAQLGNLRQFLSKVLGPRDQDSLADGQLLERYVAHRDQEAFSALVQRYGALVLGVCNRVLHNSHDAEDAFQATFFVLARQADSLDGSGALANWLYTVAYRTALKARNNAARRLAHERQVAYMQPAQIAEEDLWEEIRPMLDEELSQLPEKYRAPLVLCFLEGKSHQEAARQLGWPSGSMSRRMSRARELLRARLAQRGVALPAGVLVTVLVNHATAQAVPHALAAATAKAAVVFGAAKAGAATSLSGTVAGLAQEVLKATLVAHWKKTVSTLLLSLSMLGIIGTSGVVVMYQVSRLLQPQAQGACGNTQTEATPAAQPGK
jgi:RNA polymerase sigma-70 factor (ECF subfamily)